MNDRRNITVEDVLRRERRRGELASTLRMVATEVPRRRRNTAILVGLAMCEVAANVVVALAARSLISGALDRASADGPADGSSVSIAVILVAVVAAAAAFVATRQRQVFAHDLVLECRQLGVERLSARINDARYEDLSAVPMATLREILMTDVDHIYRFGIDLVTKVVVIVLWAVAATALTLWLSWPILVVLGIVVLAAALLVRRSLRRHAALTDSRFVHLAELSQRAREVVEVERIVLARQLGLGDHFVDRFVAGHSDYVGVVRQQQTLTASLRAALVGLNGIAFVVVIVVGALLIDAGDLTVAALIAVSFAISQLLIAVVDLGDYVQRAAETVTAGRRLSAYWADDSETDRAGAADAATPPSDSPAGRADRLRADGVGFGYGATRILDGVDLELHRGELACLTGATGAGKTTLGLLLTGVLDPDDGVVTADGEPLTSLSGSPLYIGPRPVLVEGSVLDNLFLDPAEVDRDRLEQLFAHLDSWTMPLDAPIVTSQGTGLSSGQAQTVALARAWVRDPQIVVFDEATSSLDMPTEALLQNEMMQWASQRIVLAISHRTCPWVERAAQRIRMGTDVASTLVVERTAHHSLGQSETT